MPRPPSPARRRAAACLCLTKTVLVGAVALIAVTFEVTHPPLAVPVTSDRPADSAAAARADLLVRRHACSRSGLDAVVPSRAVVLVGGDVRLVDFDTGWAVHTGRSAGTLIAVCP